METLIPGLVGGLLLAAGAFLTRLAKGKQLDPRAQIQRDIELRNMLDSSKEHDREAWAALTVSIRLGAHALITDTTDWFDRWGAQWLFVLGFIPLVAGSSILTSLDDMEDLSEGWKLLLEIAGYTVFLAGVTLVNIWGIRIFQLWRADSAHKKSQKKARDQAQSNAPQPPAEVPEKQT